jgi:integrase
MTDLAYLLDDFDGYLARKGRSPETRRSYGRTVNKLIDYAGRDSHGLTQVVCEGFFDQYARQDPPLEPATIAQRMAAVATFTAWLVERKAITVDPMLKVERPKRKHTDQLDVVTVSTEDVLRMFDACESWTEALALGIVAYLGPRRNGASRLRWRDVDLVNGTMTFRWKGGGVQTMTMPDELRELVIAYLRETVEEERTPDEYVIPNLHPWKVRRQERDDRAIWNIIRRIANRAGVRAHVHALRAAFAVFSLESGTLDLFALKEAMGHRRIETTVVYLRRLNRRKAMEQLRDLSWGGPSRYQQKQQRRIRDSNPCYLQDPSSSASAGNAQHDAPVIENPHLRALLDRLHANQRERDGSR